MMHASATQKDQRIYRYVVAYDGGTAPRPYDGLCSLAICKPKIRASAQVGDWILGFRSKHPGEVLYAMQVTERLTLCAYWEDPRFDMRKPGHAYPPDNINMPDQFGGLKQVPNAVNAPDSAARDIGGRYVLLSNQFWYFGSNSVPIPNHLLHLVHTTQGHALHVNRNADDVSRLTTWLRSWPIGLHGDPLNARHKTAEASMPSKTSSNLGGNEAANTTQQRSSCSPRTQRVPASRHEQSPPSAFDGRIIFFEEGLR